MRDPGPPQSCKRLHVYTDGSYLPGARLDRGGWAFTVLTEFAPSDDGNASHFGLLGFAGGSLRLWASSSVDVLYDCYDAEAIALAVAAAWCLALPAGLPVTISYDAAAAGAAVPEQPCHVNRIIHVRAAALARNLAQALCSKGQQVTWQWIRGHSDCSGNEVSDAVSRACAAGVFPDTPLAPHAWRAFFSADVAWTWRVYCSTSACPELEELSQGRYEPADDPSLIPPPRAQPRSSTQACLQALLLYFQRSSQGSCLAATV